MTTTEKLVLNVLAGCPAGATLDALLASCKCSAAVLDRLVSQGAIATRTMTLANPRGLMITWFYLGSSR